MRARHGPSVMRRVVMAACAAMQVYSASKVGGEEEKKGKQCRRCVSVCVQWRCSAVPVTISRVCCTRTRMAVYDPNPTTTYVSVCLPLRAASVPGGRGREREDGGNRDDGRGGRGSRVRMSSSKEGNGHIAQWCQRRGRGLARAHTHTNASLSTTASE